MRDVAIVGVGLSRWGEVWDASLRTLWTEAALAALDDAGLDHVDAITVERNALQRVLTLIEQRARGGASTGRLVMLE